MNKHIRRVISGLAAVAMIFCTAGYYPTVTQTTMSVVIAASVSYTYGAKQEVGDYSIRILSVDETAVGVEIAGYSGNSTDLVIPSELNVLEDLSLPVLEIGKGAFDNSEGALNEVVSLTSVTIPDSVTKIGTACFMSQTALESVQLSASLTTIPVSAFAGCTGLKSIVIPEGVTAIAEKAFEDCTSLTEVSLPSTLIHIGQASFSNCPVTSLTVNSNVIDSFALAGFTDLESVTFGAGMSEISDSVFTGISSLTSISFADNSAVTRIGNNAFERTGLVKAVLPDSLKSIGERAFENCPITYLDMGNGLETIGLRAFYNGLGEPSGLSNMKIKFSSSLCEIGGYAFYKRRIDGDVILPDSLETIGEDAFLNCTFDSVTFGSGTRTIGDYAFNGCKNMLYIELNEGLTEIGANAFGTCGIMGKLVLPNGLKTIGDKAFYYNTGITDVTFPDGLESIGESAFQYTSDRTAILPDSVTSIGACAFADSGLTCLRLPEKLTTISEQCFYNTKLRYAVIPNSVTVIEDNAFAINSQLVDVSFGNSVKKIGNNAFDRTGIVYLHLPDSVTEIGNGAFSGISSLIRIENWPANLEELGTGIFSLCGNLETIPAIPGEWGTIPDNMFSSCRHLTYVEISEGIATIGAGAFNETALTEVTIPDSVTNIKEHAFSYSRLCSVTLGKKVRNIGQLAFQEIGDQLKYVEIPDSVQSLGVQAFGYYSPVNNDTGYATGHLPISGFTITGNNSVAKTYCSDNGFTFNGTVPTLAEYVDSATGIHVIAEEGLEMTVDVYTDADEMQSMLGWTGGFTNVSKHDAKIYAGYNILFTKDGEPYVSDYKYKVMIPAEDVLSSAISVYANVNYSGSVGTYKAEHGYPFRKDGYVQFYDTMDASQNLAVVETSDSLKGDVTLDGQVNIADSVLFQRWLLAIPDTHLPYWQNADMNDDNRLDGFDLCLLKRKLLDN